MNKVFAVGIGSILLILLVLFTTTYTVAYHEVAVVTRFGKAGEDPVEARPGLHFRMPFFIDQVTKFDKRMQLVESPLEPVQLADGQQILVRAFLLWQVQEDGQGPLDFFKSHGKADVAIRQAGDFLTTELSTALSVLGAYDFEDLVGEHSRISEAEDALMREMVASAAGKGITARTVGVSQILLPPATTTAVLRRMETTRQTLASTERAKAQARADRIRYDANTMAEKIRAFARLQASEIIAEGDEASAKYLADMVVDEEFAIFLTWLDGLEQFLSRYTTVVLPATFAPLHLMDLGTTKLSEGHIPIPEGALALPNLEPLESHPGVAATAAPTMHPPVEPPDQAGDRQADQPGAPPANGQEEG